MRSTKTVLFSLTALLLLLAGNLSIAQESGESTGNSEPIYLEEPAAEPQARISRRQTVKQAYDDGTPRTERNIAMLSDDRVVNDGKFVEYYPNGQKYVEGRYEMGVFEGEWQYWYSNGQLCKKVTFKYGKPEGQWEVFNKDGKKTGSKSYLNGRRHGYWITYFADGEQPRFEINYEQGVPTGERIAYFPNGQKRQLVNFKDGKMNGLMIEWNEDGSKSAEATFEDGKLLGEVQRFGN